jgi:hypothetical protein
VNRFNLTFSGEILAGQDPAQVKLRFGKMFAIDDPIKLERCFSGQSVILRRNLERKAAAQYYHELHLLGVVAALVKVTTGDAVEIVARAPQPPTQKIPVDSTATSNQPDSKPATPQPHFGAIEQTWAVSSSALKRSPQAKNSRTAAKASLQKTSRAKAALAEADAARREALAVEAKRKAAEEITLKEIERAKNKRREAQKAMEAARHKAQLKEKERQEAEDAARQRAELEEIKRQEAEKAVRIKAERAARIKAEALSRQADAQRKSAERLRAAVEDLAALQALRREEKRNAADTKAQQKELKAQQSRQQADQAARLEAEQLRLEALERQEQANRGDAQQETVAQQKAAAELAQQTAPKPVKARVKTSLDLPQRKKDQASHTGAPAPSQRKRQVGEPNLYQLHPFRNTGGVRARAQQAQQRVRRGYTVGAIALAALLMAGWSFSQRPADPITTGADAIAIAPQSGPLLLAGDSLLFHDRGGNSTNEVTLGTLGLRDLEAPLAFDGTAVLFALGQLTGDRANLAGGDAPQLLRCELALSTCQHFSPDLKETSIAAFVINPLDGSLLLADRSAGQLLKTNREGKILARASVAIADHPVLRLHGGLLLMNSAEGQAISVLRYEDNAFGQQLDEILLLPPTAETTELTRVGDFLWSGDSWWVSLYSPESGSIGLYRFDGDWNYLDPVVLPLNTGPLQLVSWREKTLVNNPGNLSIQRFNAQGTVEAPLVSTQLQALIAGQQRSANITNLAWRAGLLLCALGVVSGFGFGYLQSLRRRVYKPCRERGAEPIDAYADALHWIDPVQNRTERLRRSSFSYGLLVLAALLVAVGQSVTVWQLAALLIALSGPAIALLLLSRFPVGHIGILEDKLLLADHTGMYHLAAGSSIQYRGPFLLIDDVAVFTGSLFLPAFSSPQVQTLVRPLATGGVKVDRNTVLVKLLQCRHPLAQGVIAMMAAVIAAVILLCLHDIF